MVRFFLKLLKNKAASNAAWIIACKGVQAVLGLIISMLTARLLGPADYGVLNYASSLVFFVTPVAQLGLTATLVQEMVEDPSNEGTILGTAMLSSMVSGALCVLGISLFVRIANASEPITILVCGLYSISLIAQGIELVQYWFQAKLLSKYTAIVTLVAYVLMSAYQICILAAGKGVQWYAVSKTLEYALIAAALIVIYRRLCMQHLAFSFQCLKKMLGRSWYYMLSSLMVMTFAQADRIMIKMMIGDAAMGYYSAAVVCANATEFIFLAIADSMRPVILQAKLQDRGEYEKNVSALYSVIIYFSISQSIIIAILAQMVVYLLYGVAYMPCVGALRIIFWYTAFSYIGTARNIWILAEEKQKLLWGINLCGAVVNVLLNWLLIPVWGIEGAAFASLVTQMFTNVGIGFLMPAIRGNNVLLLRALNPKAMLHFLR